LFSRSWAPTALPAGKPVPPSEAKRGRQSEQSKRISREKERKRVREEGEEEIGRKK